MLRFLDAGESHGKALCAIIEGFPSNVQINIDNINNQLKRRQKGYGRGDRMKIENDRIEVIAGIRGGKTTGTPICIEIKNKDYENWKEKMDVVNKYDEKIIIPRPGHGDLNGVLKYNLNDIRNVIERASARETSIRVAIGAICMELLANFNVKIVSRVVKIGNSEDTSIVDLKDDGAINLIEQSCISCYDKDAEKKMIKEIEKVKSIGDTLGGKVQVTAFNVPCGLGSYSAYDTKMDYNISGALMSIQGVKAVEIGEGIHASTSKGSLVNDPIILENNEFKRLTNYSGGIEAGITNGMPILANIYMKPIPTTQIGIDTVDINGNKTISRYERSDVCVLPALGVICENVLAFEITKAFLQKFSGDCIEDIKNSYDFYISRIVRG